MMVWMMSETYSSAHLPSNILQDFKTHNVALVQYIRYNSFVGISILLLATLLDTDIVF